MGLNVKIWDKYTTFVILEMINFTLFRLMKFVPFPIQHLWHDRGHKNLTFRNHNTVRITHSFYVRIMIQ